MCVCVGGGGVWNEREGRVRQGEIEKQREKEWIEVGKKRRKQCRMWRKGHARHATPLWDYSWIFCSSQLKLNRRERWQKLPWQIPLGCIRSFPVPIVSLFCPYPCLKVHQWYRMWSNFCLSTPFCSINHALSVDIADIVDIVENTHVIVEMRNKEIMVLGSQDIILSV